MMILSHSTAILSKLNPCVFKSSFSVSAVVVMGAIAWA